MNLQIFIPIALAFMMFSLGANIKGQDFRQTIKKPKALFIGLTAQLLLLPTVVFVFCACLFSSSLLDLIDNPTAFILAVFLVAVAPGGITSNAVSHLTKADSALSVSMTAISSVIFPFVLPFSYNLLLSGAAYLGWIEVQQNSIQLPIISSIAKLLTISLIPMLLGMLVAYFWSQKSNESFISFKRQLPKLSNVFFLIMVVSLVISNYPSLPPVFSFQSLLIIILACCIFGSGWLLAKTFSLSGKQCKTIAIEASIQNAGTAILVATLLLGQNKLANIALMYGILTALISLAAISYYSLIKVEDNL